MSSPYCDIRDRILGNAVRMIELDKLQEPAEEKNTMFDYNFTFKRLKMQYIEFLIVMCVGSAIKCRVSPPQQVDTLWRLHVRENESYVALVAWIIDEVGNVSIKKLKLTMKTHHKSFIEKKDRKGELNVTELLYIELGFDFIQCVSKGSQSSTKRKLKTTNPEKPKRALHNSFRIFMETDDGKRFSFRAKSHTMVHILMREAKEILRTDQLHLFKTTPDGRVRDNIHSGTMADNQIGEGDVVKVIFHRERINFSVDTPDERIAFHASPHCGIKKLIGAIEHKLQAPIKLLSPTTCEIISTGTAAENGIGEGSSLQAIYS